MKNLMESLRKNHLKSLGKIGVAKINDYQQKYVFDAVNGSIVGKIDLPASDVLQWHLGDGSVVTCRPSGTEPKIKFYASCCEKDSSDLQKAKIAVKSKLEAIRVDINNILAEAEK
jgi:phosphoglucomutase